MTPSSRQNEHEQSEKKTHILTTKILLSGISTLTTKVEILPLTKQTTSENVQHKRETVPPALEPPNSFLVLVSSSFEGIVCFFACAAHPLHFFPVSSVFVGFSAMERGYSADAVAVVRFDSKQV